MTSILLIEDNEDLAFGLRNNLEIEGYEVMLAADGAVGLSLIDRARPDLVVLDLMLPGADGYRVLKHLREADSSTPVLILTAKSEEADKVRGFRCGADDYVTKPFGVLELLARIEALLRRSHPSTVRTTPKFGSIEVLIDRRTVRREGIDVALTPMEFDLLVALLNRKGALATRVELLTEVWGHSAAVLTRTVDTHIAELRRKLEDDPGKPRHILTVRKAGYRLDSQ
jgi:two-component system, OmpR family, alkaline phosphatase synthesis response regulator PhoP